MYVNQLDSSTIQCVHTSIYRAVHCEYVGFLTIRKLIHNYHCISYKLFTFNVKNKFIFLLYQNENTFTIDVTVLKPNNSLFKKEKWQIKINAWWRKEHSCLSTAVWCMCDWRRQKHLTQLLWSSSPIGKRKASHSTGASVTWELSPEPLKLALEVNNHLLTGTWSLSPWWYWDYSFNVLIQHAWEEAVAFIEAWGEFRVPMGAEPRCCIDFRFRSICHFKDLLFKICKKPEFWGARCPRIRKMDDSAYGGLRSGEWMRS